ncbi:MAG TPA: carbohydrate ABC transporter permease [Streptosporangiaceae bacterium]|jgi:ABC-type glycerol-3-phosphate transport system permease component|nr:carbohydrate ABC transporter permease [Streptosporangiaceae bacterium]
MTAAVAGAGTTAVPARRRTGGTRARKIAKEVLFYLAALIVVVIALFPFYWILRTSLESNAQVAAGVGGQNGIIPSHLSGSAYVNVFKQQHFLTPLINSAIVALGATAVTIVVASLAGYALARLQIRGAGAILAFILLAGFFPVIAMVGPLFLVLKNLGVLDNIYPLIIVYLVYTLPISTWLLRNFFAQIPAELEEAALIDGATRLQTLRKVVVPVAIPGVFTAAILSFILAWNDFAFAVSFLQTPGHFTAPLAIVTFGESQFQVFYNLIDSAVVIISIPIALLVLFLQRRIVSGLTAGSFR